MTERRLNDTVARSRVLDALDVLADIANRVTPATRASLSEVAGHLARDVLPELDRLELADALALEETLERVNRLAATPRIHVGKDTDEEAKPRPGDVNGVLIIPPELRLGAPRRGPSGPVEVHVHKTELERRVEALEVWRAASTLPGRVAALEDGIATLDRTSARAEAVEWHATRIEEARRELFALVHPGTDEPTLAGRVQALREDVLKRVDVIEAVDARVGAVAELAARIDRERADASRRTRLVLGTIAGALGIEVLDGADGSPAVIGPPLRLEAIERALDVLGDRVASLSARIDGHGNRIAGIETTDLRRRRRSWFPRLPL